VLLRLNDGVNACFLNHYGLLARSDSIEDPAGGTSLLGALPAFVTYIDHIVLT